MNDVQADDSDYLGTKLTRVLGGEAAALNTLLARLRPYLHYLVREQLASAERYQDHGSDFVQETLVRVYRGLDPSRGTAGVHFHGQSVPIRQTVTSETLGTSSPMDYRPPRGWEAFHSVENGIAGRSSLLNTDQAGVLLQA